MARSYMQRLPRTVQRDDIEQAALIGLVDGLRKHPDGTGPTFDFYLRMRIRGEIIDELRAQDWATRRNRAGGTAMKMLHLEDVNAQWGDLMQGAHEDVELAAIARLDGEKAWRSPMKARDLRMLRGRYERGQLQRELAVVEGVSEARVCQRLTVVLASIRTHLAGPIPLAKCGALPDAP
jgi:RNA polymerase sigma factor for flagellar operon FliA